MTKVTKLAQRDPDWFVHDVTEPHLTDLDTVFVWLRYVHFMLLPLLVFAIHKELRKKAKELLCCCCWRPNTVESHSPRPVSQYLREHQKMLKEQKKKFKNITNYT